MFGHLEHVRSDLLPFSMIASDAVPMARLGEPHGAGGMRAAAVLDEVGVVRIDVHVSNGTPSHSVSTGRSSSRGPGRCTWCRARDRPGRADAR